MIIFKDLEKISFDIPGESSLINWLNKVIRFEKKLEGEITYKIVSDEELLKINEYYLQHFDFTDIITFDTSNCEEVVSGNIFISYERIIENSTTFAQDITNEFLRVVVHGVLHLCGYKDKSQVEKTQMRKLEDKYISAYFN